VGTPIGNLGDLTPRAREVLATVDTIAAEDTRTARQLLRHLGIRKPLVSYHAHTAPERRAALVERLAEHDLALVSEAGTPGVSDPGAALVAAAHAAGHPVVAVPGPSAVSAALSIAGLPADSYLFLGFLPRRRADRRSLLSEIAGERRTLVAFETPHRLRAGLADLLAVLGDRTVVVAREITKLHEESWRGTLAEAVARWSDVPARGEFTLVVAGAEPVEAPSWDERRVRAALADLRATGLGAREASRRVAAEAGWTAREVYKLWEHDT
jgi:16S rRNA (cytidine1402-2'-O)-methyltransferase